MHRSHFLSLLVLAFVTFATACASSVTPMTDAGDAQTSEASACGMSPSGRCAYGTAGGACGDTEVAQVCVNGAWQCPSGTIPIERCRCLGLPVGSCTCTSTGWQCVGDAGVDAPSVCPTDLGAADGTPCTQDGQSCGACSDRCQSCNILQCQSGRWSLLEVSPDPRCTSTFACGTMQCSLLSQYCQVTLDDTGGPNLYQCFALPAACNSNASCECVTGSAPGQSCAQSSEGAVTVTNGGG